MLKVTAITMRQNPIWQTALTGMPVTENHTLIEYGNAAVVYREVKKVVPEVRGVNMTPGGTFRHHVVVSIKKRAENEGRNVILALLSMPATIDPICVEVPDPRGPFGAKGIGESALIPVAPAIANAIYDAVGVRLNDLPMSPAKVCAAVLAKEAPV